MDDPSQVIAWATAAVCVQARPVTPDWKKYSCSHWWNPCHQLVLGPGAKAVANGWLARPATVISQGKASAIFASKG